MRAYLESNFSSIGDIIKYGRCLAYDSESTTFSEWETELVNAVKEAGFVRPKTDFARSFNIGSLYADIFGFYDGFDGFIRRIDQLSNEQYESFVGMSDETIERVKLSLRTVLTERQYEVIYLLYGLGDSERQTPKTIAQRLQISVSSVYNTKTYAESHLRRYNTLPALFDASIELNETLYNLKIELDELRKDPVFERERELLRKIAVMRKKPFKYSDALEEQFETSESLESMPISKLGLSYRVFYALLRAPVRNVNDILCFPANKWRDIRWFGPSYAKEVIDAMRSIGYKDFDIDI